MTSVRQVTDAILAALLAPPCASCGRVLDRPLAGAVCTDCWAALPRHPGPVASLSAHISRSTAIGEYEGTLRAIIHALKYDGRRSASHGLSATLASCAARLLADADAVVPVPLHRRRERERGFNQAHDLAMRSRPAGLAGTAAPARYAVAGRSACRQTTPQRSRRLCDRHADVPFVLESLDSARAGAPRRRGRRARRRCDDDRGDARGVRADAGGSGRARGAGALQQPELGVHHADHGGADAVLVLRPVERDPRRRGRLPSIAVADAPEQREILLVAVAGPLFALERPLQEECRAGR